jgi:hypothetical protein
MEQQDLPDNKELMVQQVQQDNKEILELME